MFDGPKYPKFRWFDCNDPAIESLVTEALGRWGRGTALGRSLNDIEIRRNAMRYLLSAMASTGPDGLPIEIALGKDKSITSRYPKGYAKALEQLLQDGWIVHSVLPNPTGSWSLYDDAQGKVNRPKRPRGWTGTLKGSAGCYGLCSKAWERLQEGAFNINSLVPSRNRSIRVKDTKANTKAELWPRPVHDNLETWLDQIEQYNELLKAFTFSVDGNQVSPIALQLNRVFNNGGYDQGGRFYSAFDNWDSYKRKRLTIDGQFVLMADYKNLHGRLSFASVGQSCTLGDLYQFKGFDREDVKTAWSAALNVKNNTGYSGAPKSKEIIKAVIKQHPNLKGLFGQGYGLFFQRADAELVSVVLECFIKAGRPVVPCHDGFYFLEVDRQLFNKARAKGERALFKMLATVFPVSHSIALPLDILTYQ